jgi:hypothetical protein
MLKTPGLERSFSIRPRLARVDRLTEEVVVGWIPDPPIQRYAHPKGSGMVETLLLDIHEHLGDRL